MKDIGYKKAGVLIAIVSLVMVLGLYAVLGTVDLVYTNGDREIYRQEGVRIISTIEDPMEKMDEEFITGEDMKFTFTSGKKTKTFDPADPKELKTEIVKTLVVNLVTFDWKEANYVITINAK